MTPSDPAAQLWDDLAEGQPFFGSLGDPRYVGLDLAKVDREAFFASGQGDVDHALSLLRRHYTPPARFDHALDFGCGVGRWTRAMLDHADAVTGVDVSRAMLRRAKRLVRNATFSEHVPNPTDGASFDWINSFLTFPHILPGRGLELLNALLSIAAKDCALTLHIGTKIVSPPPDTAGPTAFFAADLPEWMDRLYRAGFASCVTEYLDFGAYQGVRLVSARGRYRET